MEVGKLSKPSPIVDKELRLRPYKFGIRAVDPRMVGKMEARMIEVEEKMEGLPKKVTMEGLMETCFIEVTERQMTLEEKMDGQFAKA